MRNLPDRGIHVFEHHHPFRTVTFVEDEEEYKYAILGDSLVFGVYIKSALVISCPGGRISRVDTPAIMQYLILKGVQGVGLMIGTNNLVDREGNENEAAEIAEQLRTLIDHLLDANIKPCVFKVPGRRGHKEAINSLKKEYRKLAQEKGLVFHVPRRCTFRGIGRDGLHPDETSLNRLGEDLYDGVRKLC